MEGKLALADTLIGPPHPPILDDLTVALDKESRKPLKETLETTLNKGKTTATSSHITTENRKHSHHLHRRNTYKRLNKKQPKTI